MSGAPELVKLRQYFDHPLFVEMFTDAIAAAAKQTLPDELRDDARLVFTAHSIPLPPTNGTARICTAARSPMRQGWSPRRRDTTTTTRCGSHGPDRRRSRGWSPMSPIT